MRCKKLPKTMKINCHKEHALFITIQYGIHRRA